MMKKEYKYFGAISSVFLASITALAILLRKYAFLTFQHFVETCKQIAATFFSSGPHYIGLALLALAFLTALVFFIKTLFSLVKTQKKVSKLLAKRSGTIPKKLQNVLRNVELEKDKVVVIKKQSSYAFSFGLRSQKIILSEGLIKKLTPKQLEAVVLHEKYHLENQHSLLLVLSEIISSTLFFLPLAAGINKKMRVVFENQADAFTISIQKSNIHLSKALLKATNSRISVYPNFSRRNRSKISRMSIFISSLVGVFAVFLFLFSTQLEAARPTLTLNKIKACNESFCTTKCPAQGNNHGLVTTSNYQYNPSPISYLY